MGLYKLFSCNVEIQYKSCLLSKATLFTLVTTILNIILPFIIAHRSRGFWLRSQYYYEQPVIRFGYEYILVAETNDPRHPIVCEETSLLKKEDITGEENCYQIQVQETDNNGDGKNDDLEIQFNINVPLEKSITSVFVILSLDYQLKTLCPLHMQSLAVAERVFPFPPSSWTFYGDLNLYQVSHLPCLRHNIDVKYNSSILEMEQTANENTIDFIMRNYFQRAVTTQVKEFYSKAENGHTGQMKIKIHLRIPEMKIEYLPSLLQELKWAWPQYLSLAFVFYWIFNRIKRFVFNNRLLMAWEVIPWKKYK